MTLAKPGSPNANSESHKTPSHRALDLIRRMHHEELEAMAAVGPLGRAFAGPRSVSRCSFSAGAQVRQMEAQAKHDLQVAYNEKDPCFTGLYDDTSTDHFAPPERTLPRRRPPLQIPRKLAGGSQRKSKGKGCSTPRCEVISCLRFTRQARRRCSHLFAELLPCLSDLGSSFAARSAPSRTRRGVRSPSRSRKQRTPSCRLTS